MKTKSSWLILLSAFLTAAALCAESRPIFFILQENANVADESLKLEKLGVRVRQRVPPRIIVGEFSRSVSLSSVKILDQFMGPVPIDRLEPMGELAVAAGLNWNRQVLKSAQTMGNFAATRAMVAQQSLPAPANVSAVSNGQFITINFNAVDGASYYELQLSPQTDFGTSSLRTLSNRPSVMVPESTRGTSGELYVRVRVVDHLEGEHVPTDDVSGAWSNVASVPNMLPPGSLPVEPPALTSPLDKYESEGHTVALEWSAASTSDSRIQISRSSSFSETLVDEVIRGGEYIVPGSVLHVGDSLYWRVRRVGSESSGWSSSRQFKVGAPVSHQADMFINPESPQ